MLQAMRQNTRIILWVTVVAFVLLMALVWGADLRPGGGGGGGRAQAGAIGSVNGEVIPYTTYQTALAQNREQASRQGRDLLPSDYLMLEEQTWNSIVDQMLLDQEAKRRHLQAHDSEIRAVLLNDPPAFIQQEPTFQGADGRFDMAKYRQFINDPSTPESVLLQIEAFVRAQLPMQKLQQAVTAGAKVSDDEVRRAWLESNEKANLSYVVIDVAGPGVSVTDPTDAEIASYYEDHRDRYELPERADLVYVTIPRRASAADSLQLQDDLRGFASEARTAEKAKDEGREDLEHSDFAALAAAFSDAPTADDGGLSPGFLAPNEMSPAYRQAVADLPVGAISAPFRDGQFYRIVQVAADKTEDGTRRIQARDISLRIAPSDSTIGAAREQLDELRQAASTSDLEKAAEAQGIPVQRADDVTESGIVPGLSTIPQLGSFAVRSHPGTLSRVYETNTAWFLVQVVDHKPAGAPPLDAVKERVRQDMIRDRQFEATRSRADALVARVRGGMTLEQAAAAESLTVSKADDVTRVGGIPGLGREPEVVGAAFALGIGDVSEPLRGSRGWVVLRVDARPALDEAAYAQQKESLRQNLLGMKQGQIFNAWLEDLRRSAKIQDYRYQI